MHTNLTVSGFYDPLGGSKHIFEVRRKKTQRRKRVSYHLLYLRVSDTRLIRSNMDQEKYPRSSIEDDFNYGTNVATASVHIRMGES